MKLKQALLGLALAIGFTAIGMEEAAAQNHEVRVKNETGQPVNVSLRHNFIPTTYYHVEGGVNANSTSSPMKVADGYSNWNWTVYVWDAYGNEVARYYPVNCNLQDVEIHVKKDRNGWHVSKEYH